MTIENANNPHQLFAGNDDVIIRYVHINERMEFDGRTINGITIAYVRDKENVYFAATLCSKNDTYVKSVGREFSSKMLRETIDVLMKVPVEEGSMKSRANHGIVGLINMDFITSCLGPVLSVQTESKLTPMDFRHSFLSLCLGYAIFPDGK